VRGGAMVKAFTTGGIGDIKVVELFFEMQWL
jgi:hypothetical protein